MIKKIATVFYVLILISSCRQNDAVTNEGATPETRTPVTLTGISYVPLQEFIDLNATSSYLQKSFVKSNIIGYVQRVNVRIGQHVNKGEQLFILKTKEAAAIGNAIDKLNPGFRFSGVNYIAANTNGFIAELDHQQGDYVQDGEQLAVISDAASFAFIMNVPYEDMQYVTQGKAAEIILPDKTHLPATIAAAMPVMDSIAQTQTFAIKVAASQKIPQNLVAIVRIIKISKASTATLPRSAVLSDETQTEFWVMKMINDSTAVKVPVKKGIEMDNKTEILSPVFSPNDKMVLSGNYGLADTALVIVK